MKFRLAGLVRDSYVDGPGIRMAIFMQGCPHHCQGCHNPETWNADGGKLETVDMIKAEISRDPLLTGITLTGGEPFLQPRPAHELARYAHDIGLDVWCYTGYTFEEVMMLGDDCLDLLQEVDVLVDGPFKIDQRTLSLPWRGSKNQRLIDVPQSMSTNTVVCYKI